MQVTAITVTGTGSVPAPPMSVYVVTTGPLPPSGAVAWVSRSAFTIVCCAPMLTVQRSLKWNCAPTGRRSVVARSSSLMSAVLVSTITVSSSL